MIAALPALALTLASPPCAPITRNAEADASIRAAEWVIVGELHGSKEVPAVFGDLVCGLSASRVHVVVALELPQSAQAALDEFTVSDGGRAALLKLIASSSWHEDYPDGRTSRAMVDLLDVLRKLRRVGRIERVVGILPDATDRKLAHDEAMAKGLINAATYHSLVIALVGNLHARLAIASDAKVPFLRPMASFLPREKVISLNVSVNGGRVWGCFRVDTDMSCGEHELPDTGRHFDRSIVLLPSLQFYSGFLNIGTRVTPSPPVNSQQPE